MFRLFHIAEKNGLQIFYQDTDSLQGPRFDIRKLASCMEAALESGELSRLELPPMTDDAAIERLRPDIRDVVQKGFRVEKFEGSMLGQFHSDFEIGGVESVRDVPIVGVGAVYVGKKSYCVRLRSLYMGDDGREHVKIAHHCRMKGVPGYAIQDYCKKEGIDEFELYMRLYRGEKVTFQLAAGGRPVFRKTKAIQQITIDDFSRTVGF